MGLLAGPYKVKALYNPISETETISVTEIDVPRLIERFRYQQKPSARDTKSHLRTSDLRLIKLAARYHRHHQRLNLLSFLSSLVSVLFI